MNILKAIKLYTLFIEKEFLMFISERGRDRGWAGEGQKEGAQNVKRAPGSELSAPSSNSQAMIITWAEVRVLNRLNQPGNPLFIYLLIVKYLFLGHPDGCRLSIWLLVSAQVMIAWFHEFKPHIRLCAGSGVPAWDSLSPSLCPSPTCTVSVSLKINFKNFKNRGAWMC